VAELALDKQMLQEVVQKSGDHRPTAAVHQLRWVVAAQSLGQALPD
jgi:hypothetical protein